MPFPCALVVKNGSKMCSRTSFGMLLELAALLCCCEEEGPAVTKATEKTGNAVQKFREKVRSR